MGQASSRALFEFHSAQEMLAPRIKKLRETQNTVFRGQIPAGWNSAIETLPATCSSGGACYDQHNAMLVLFLLLFLGQPVYYFWFELIPLNMLFVYLIVRQEKMAESLEQLLVARHST